MKEYQGMMGYLKMVISGVGRSLFLWFLGIALTPLIFLGWQSYNSALSAFQNNAEASLFAAIQLKKTYISQFFKEGLKDLEIQASLGANIALLNSLKATDNGDLNQIQNTGGPTSSLDLQDNLNKFAEVNFYRNVFMSDEKGTIFFTTRSGPTRGPNLFNDYPNSSKLARAARRALETGNAVCTDFMQSQNNEGSLTAYLIKSMLDRDEVIVGIMGFELPIDKIDLLVQDPNGLGETGESFLIGSDYLMRSNSRFSNERTVLVHSEKTELTQLWRQGLRIGAKNGKPLVYQNSRGIQVFGMLAPLDELKAINLDWALIAELGMDEVFAPSLVVRNRIVLMIFLATGLALIMVFFATHRIVKPLRQITGWAKRVSAGNLTQPDFNMPKNEIGELQAYFSKVVDNILDATKTCELIAVGNFEQAQKSSEHDRLSLSVSQMVENLRAVVHQANAVAKGDYSTEIHPRSDQDQLGLALKNMTTRLSRLRDNKEFQDWEKAGETELNACMRGEHDLQALCEKIIQFLAVKMKAGVGAIYTLEENRLLQMKGSYAFKKRKSLSNTFKLGEGLVGQAALERKTIHLTSVPDDYVHIESGLGQAAPMEIIATPFFFENEIKGIVELGTFESFAQSEVKFLEKVATDLGISVNTAQSRARMRDLLEQTQRQAEALKKGQEELKSANAYLEEQTSALKQSEAQLQNQQEELQQTNEELEERTEALEIQRDEIKRKNLELERARNEITQKARDLEQTSTYKSQFLANMSHELRTPLNSLLILAQMLQANKDNNLTEKQVNFAKTIYQSGSDLLHLINEILDLSKIEAGQMTIHLESMKIQTFFSGVNRRFDHMAEKKGLSFSVIAEQDAPSQIITDRQRLEQIITNLLSNAFKFTEQGGVSLKVFRPGPQVDLSISGLKHHEAIAFSVEDTGLGIPKDKQMRIFEAFQQADGTTSRKFGGTGLGLSISRELARLLKGELQLKSVHGEGSNFTLYLPVSHPNAPESKDQMQGVVEIKPEQNEDVQSIATPPHQETEEPRPAVEEKTPPGFPLDDRQDIEPNDRCLLIVEDDPKFARIMLNLARERGFKGILAEDGETGLYLADYFRPHAIVLDIGLPRMNGLAVLSRLKDNPDTRPIPVHVVSGFDKDFETRKMGAIGYLSKPASLADIDLAFSKIDSVLDSSVKNLLVIENDPVLKDKILTSIKGKDLKIETVKTGSQALKALKVKAFDALILDFDLPDQQPLSLLETIRADAGIPWLPIIVFTDHPISEDEKSNLDPYVESVVVKPDKIPERILDETILFLHRVEEDLDENQRDILRMIHNKEAIFKDRKILIVDDDMRNVFALTSVLEEKGVHVLVGRNGREGLEKLDANPDAALVLMDIMMPEMDGYEAIRRIRQKEQFKELPIIALTAKAMKTDRRKCIDAGANDYMTKPLDTVKLFSLMRVWLY